MLPIDYCLHCHISDHFYDCDSPNTSNQGRLLTAINTVFMQFIYAQRHIFAAISQCSVAHLTIGLLELIPVVGLVVAIADVYFGKDMSIPVIQECSNELSQRITDALVSHFTSEEQIEISMNYEILQGEMVISFDNKRIPLRSYLATLSQVNIPELSDDQNQAYFNKTTLLHPQILTGKKISEQALSIYTGIGFGVMNHLMRKGYLHDPYGTYSYFAHYPNENDGLEVLFLCLMMTCELRSLPVPEESTSIRHTQLPASVIKMIAAAKRTNELVGNLGFFSASCNLHSDFEPLVFFGDENENLTFEIKRLDTGSKGAKSSQSVSLEYEVIFQPGTVYNVDEMAYEIEDFWNRRVHVKLSEQEATQEQLKKHTFWVL